MASGESKKPAGWRFLDEQYWSKGLQKKCKECLKASALGSSLVESHERKCSAFPAGTRVVVSEEEADERRALYGQRQPHSFDAALEAIARAPMRSRPLGKKPPKPVRYEVFKAFVRAKPCRLCGLEGPSDPHHFGPRGVSQKTSDLRLVPLCDSNPATGYEGHHDYFHRTGSLPGMDRVGTEAWINAAILELHDEFFGAWISSGESPDALDDRLADALDASGEEPI